MEREFIQEVNDWLGSDHLREALLISEAPVSQYTLRFIRLGRYVASDRMKRKIRDVMTRYGDRLSSPSREIEASAAT